MRKGDLVELAVDDLDPEGAGIGTVDELRIHVAGSAPGERVRARLEHRSPHRPEGWAELVEIVTPSHSRVAPACRGYGPCGGCRLEHLDYAAQIAWKQSHAARVLAQFPVESIVPSPRPLGYRNRERRVYALLDGKPVLGAYAPRTHEVVDLAGCAVAEPPLDEAAGALARLLDGIPAFDEKTREGNLRYVILRVNARGQVLVTLVVAQAPLDGGLAIAHALMAARPEVVGVTINVNATLGNRLLGDVDVPLDGAMHLEEEIGAVRLRLSPASFFQANRFIAARLYADAIDAAKLDGTERVLDAYSGVGGLALTAAPRAREVIGIEENPAAVEDARASAALSGIGNAKFLAGDVGALLGDQAAEVVILDPPRKGLTPSVTAALKKSRPRTIVYVSCEISTLARDLATLSEGWRVERVTPYDMLPQTPHVEALAILTR